MYHLCNGYYVFYITTNIFVIVFRLLAVRLSFISISILTFHNYHVKICRFSVVPLISTHVLTSSPAYPVLILPYMNVIIYMYKLQELKL